MLMHQELVEVFQILCCSIVNAHHIVGAFLHGLLVLLEAFYLPDIGTYYGCLSFLKAFCLNVLLPQAPTTLSPGIGCLSTCRHWDDGRRISHVSAILRLPLYSILLI